MTKDQAIALFGGKKATAHTLQITDSAVTMWPQVLGRPTIDKIIATLVRQGRSKEAQAIAKETKEAT